MVASNNTPLLLVDNGAHSIKAAVVTGNESFICPNGVFRSKVDKKTFVGDELDKLATDYSGINYKLPFEKGLLTNWDAQKTVWDRLFRDEIFKIDTKNTSLYLTEPVLNLPNIQESYDQIIFEEYEFPSYYRSPASLVAPWGPCKYNKKRPLSECALVIDSGFSFTNIVPIINGDIIHDSVRRIDIGGKLMTNYLKELVSFRYWNMMDLTYVINVVKERCCFVSQDFFVDLETCHRYGTATSIMQSYVLPDFTPAQMATDKRLGYILTPEEEASKSNKVDDESILRLSNERFTVPELLFNPSIIGLNQGGIHETVVSSINSLDPSIQGMFWSNIKCVGGNFNLPGFYDRLNAELQALCPVEYLLDLDTAIDPVNYFIPSARKLFRSRDGFADFVKSRFVTRAEFLEEGSRVTRRKFGDDEDWFPLLDNVQNDDWDDEELIDGSKKSKSKKSKKSSSTSNNKK